MSVIGVFVLAVGTLSSFFGTSYLVAQGTADLPIYADALPSGWVAATYNDATIDINNTAPVYQGSRSVAITYNGAWAGADLVNWSGSLDASAYDTLRFWVNGGTGGGYPVIFTFHFDGGVTIAKTVTPVANTWTQEEVSLLGYSSLAIFRVEMFNNSNQAHPTFYVDNIILVDTGATPPPPTSGPTLSVDANADQHPISPYIYGMNFAAEDLAEDLQLPVRRWGGNSTTRYNWQTNVHNVGSDWYFENIPNSTSADGFVAQNNRTGSETLMTIPLIGWTPKVGATSHPYDCGFKVSKYGAQDSVDEWDPDCGNGEQGGNPITGNDPADTSMAITPAFVTTWIQHFIATYGTAANGGVQFYNLDNEPMLWNSTHRDVHPEPPTAAELRDKTYAYASAIKAADPTAQTLGPVVWGWCNYFCSASAGCCSPDAGTTGDRGRFVEWYLEQMHAYETDHGTRILDYLDVHYYPAASGVALRDAGSASTQALRLRSTRSLWDPTYHDESWIEDTTDEPIQMIRRMKQWVADNYPGTKTAITEYNWGALNHINGALAQADVLGIFGREGLDLATLWGPPDSDDPGAYAFRMYLNYDGDGAKFGDVSVRGASSDQEKLAIYAARRSSDGALTLMIVNKTGQAFDSTVSLANFSHGSTAEVYRYSSASLSAIVHEADQTVDANGFTATFPANSITLVVLAPDDGPFVPLTGVEITGWGTCAIGLPYTYQAIVSPSNASRPITYTWSPDPVQGQGTATANYLWSSVGTYAITVTAQNDGAVFTDVHIINVEDLDLYHIYLPLILR
ncbi:MAG: endoglucanase [Anaerolineae bacterium]|nr:endoglucanase [Anaerolineae bacterium]